MRTKKLSVWVVEKWALGEPRGRWYVHRMAHTRAEAWQLMALARDARPQNPRHWVRVVKYVSTR